MTPEERWEKIDKNQTVMQDQIIVTARMQQEGEKRWANQTADVWEGFAHLTRSQVRMSDAMQHLANAQSETNAALQQLAAKVDRLADQQAMTQTALESLIATVDKFVKDQTGNGHHDH